MTGSAAALRLALAVVLGLAAAPASGQYPGRDSRCFEDHHGERCRALRVRMQRELYDLTPIGTLAREGVQVRRAFYVMGAHPANVGALSFYRRPGAAPRVEFRIPRRNGRVRRVSAEVPPEIWAQVLARSVGFERILASPQAAAGSVCMHPSFYNVEAADPPAAGRPGAVLARHDSICAVSRAPEYAFYLAGLAITQIPRCRALDNDNAVSFSLLATCAALDSVAAAEVHNAIDVLFEWGNGDEAGVRDLFAAGASLDWSGEHASGDGAAARWLREMRTRNAALAWERIEPAGNDRARVSGYLLYSVSGDAPDYRDRDYRARVALDLARGADGRFRVARASVGRFARSG
jgi:hypothetical protein